MTSDERWVAPERPEGAAPEPPVERPEGAAAGTRRLHVAAVGADALRGLQQTALPLLVVGILGHGFSLTALFYGLAGIGFSAVFGILQWTTTRWWLGAGEIGLRTGLLKESIKTVPYDRVQAVDTVRGPIQRLLGAVELHVQAAGGGRRAEIVLRAVSPADAADLRAATTLNHPPKSARHLSEADPSTPHDAGAATLDLPAKGARPGWELGTGRLLAAAATSASLGVLVPVVAALSQMGDELIGAQDAERLVPRTAGGIALLVAAVLAVAWILSFLGTIAAFAGFRVERDGDRLRITRGIVERREASVPVARVHAVRIVENPLRQPFGLAQVRIETAGYAKERATAQTLLPLVRRDQARAVLAELLPELDAPLDVDPLPRRAARRYALPPAAAALAVAVALAIVAGPAAGLAALVLVALTAAAGLAAYATAGIGLHGDRVVLRGRTRTLSRTTATADARRLQSISTSTTPFQRRGDLATLAVDVSSGRRLHVRHLDAATSARHVAALAAAATTGPMTRRP